MIAAPESTTYANPSRRSSDQVWDKIALSYAAFRSPFVPCQEDIAIYEGAVATQAKQCGGRRVNALVLGVTPGLVRMKWPRETRLIAVEISPTVIDSLWPGDIPEMRTALCASWLSIPTMPGLCDVVIGDGSLSTCCFPNEVCSLVRSISNQLVDEGIFVFRSYVRPPKQETLEEVFEALFSPRGMSVDHFKMRLYLAMQLSAKSGVAVRDADKILRHYNLNPRIMQDRLGWSPAAIDPFTAWRTSDAIYSFPTLEELRRVFDHRFDQVSVTFPEYELGHCCPTFVMRFKSARNR